MQAARNGLRAVAHRPASQFQAMQPHLIASSSRVQYDAHRAYAWNPVEWFSRKLSPQVREKDDKAEVERARQELKESGQASVFETVTKPDADAGSIVVATSAEGKKTKRRAREKISEQKFQTQVMKVSHRKLNMLSRQIAGKPIDSAIMQMAFSEKRISDRIKTLLTDARTKAIRGGLQRDKLIVAESWVNKGPGGRQNMRVEFKGRSKIGFRKVYKSRMHVLLKEGLTLEEKKQKEMDYKLRRIVSAGLVREDVPLRNPHPGWAW